MNREVSLTAAVVAYNARSCICACLDALLRTDIGKENILVVDDGSTDDTRIIIKNNYPMIKIIELDENIGHSISCNLAIKESQTDWVVIMDHDTEVSDSWLTELRQAISSHLGAGIVNSRAIFYQDMMKVHCDGGYAHFLGNMRLLNGYTNLEDAENQDCEIGAAATISMAVNREKALYVGLFDEDFFVYLNDFEFSLRMRLAGFKIYTAMSSVIYHKGGTPELSYRGGSRYPKFRAYLILRNRWFLILKLYELKTIILCAPVFLLYELMLFVMSIKRGVFPEYYKALCWIISHRELIRRKRHQVKILRKITDGELLSSGSLTFVPGLVTSMVGLSMKKFADKVFGSYWSAVRKFL